MVGSRRAERCAIRQNAGSGADRKLAERQQVRIDLELRQAIAERRQTGGAAADQPVEIAFLLLQVPRLQEQPFPQTTLFSHSISLTAGLAWCRGKLDAVALGSDGYCRRLVSGKIAIGSPGRVLEISVCRENAQSVHGL